MTVSVAPCVRSVRAASSDILPAPTISTRRRAKSPTTWRAKSTATELTDTGLRAIAVSRRTRRRDAERALLEAGAEHRARGAVLDGGLVRLLGLAEDLRLAHDQRIEAGGDAEQVAHGGRVPVLVEVLCQIAHGDARAPRQHFGQPGGRAVGVVDGDVQLDAVAGRDHHRLAHRRQRGQLGERRAATASGSTASRSRTATGAVRCETPTSSRSMDAPPIFYTACRMK